MPTYEPEQGGAARASGSAANRATIPRPIRIEPAFADREFVRELFNRHAPYRALADLLTPAALWHAFATAGRPLDSDQRQALQDYDYVLFVDSRPITLANGTELKPVYPPLEISSARSLAERAPRLKSSAKGSTNIVRGRLVSCE